MLDFEQLVSGVDKDAMVELPLDKIFVVPGQPRIKFEESVEKIRQSLIAIDPYTKKPGIIRKPIDVLPPDENGNHRVINGECRYRASKLESRELIRAIVRWDLKDASEGEIYLEQISDNGQRTDLSPEELGESAVKAKEKYGHSLEVVATANGKPISYISECVTVYKALNTPKFDFIADLYVNGVSQDVRVINVLLRMAERNLEETKRLVEWGVENYCVTRNWVDQLKDMDETAALETKISKLEENAEAERIAKEKRQQELADKKAAKKAKKEIPKLDNLPEEGVGGAGTADNNSFQPADEKAEIKPQIIGVPVEGDNSEHQLELDVEKEVSNASYSVRPVAKAKLHVLHNGKPAVVLLDRKDNEQGFMWIHIFGEGEKRVPMDELVIFDLE